MFLLSRSVFDLFTGGGGGGGAAAVCTPRYLILESVYLVFMVINNINN